MKSLKKVLALLVVAILALASVSALADAATDPLTSGNGVVETNATTLTIYKSVVVENPEKEITVAYPEMKFTYEVTSKAPAEGADVNDGQNTATVTAGVPDGIALASNTVIIPAGTVELNKNGQEIVDAPLTVKVDLSKFSSPGIYRYAITDVTPAADLVNPGVVRGLTDDDKEYVLDLYLRNHQTSEGSEGTEGTLEVAGYVLTHENVTHINGETPKDSGFDRVDITTEEIPGTPGEPGQPGTDPTYERKLNENTDPAVLAHNDFYYTYNVTLTKKVTGDMGSHTNTFEFALDITNDTHDAEAQTLNYYVDGRTANGDTEEAQKTANLTTAYAKDGDTVTIYGLNPYAKVNYTETNNSDFTYTYVKVFDKTSAETELKKVDSVAVNAEVKAYDEAQEIAEFSASAKAAEKVAAAVTYENNLTEVSPTGVVLRFAPYLAMLAAGLVIVLVARRKKNED